MLTLEGSSAYGPLESGVTPDVYYVYMLDGTVHEVGPADTLRVTSSAVELSLGDVVVARFDRKDVFTCTRGVRISPHLG